MQEKAKNRIFYFDNLKFILIFLVVLGHFAEVIYSKYPFLTAVRYFIYMFHMPLFIFVSGIFSKSREYSLKKTFIRAAELFMWYTVVKLAIFVLEAVILGNPDYEFDFFTESGIPWYLLAMAFWTLTVPLIRKIPAAVILPLSLAVSAASGYFSELGDFLVLSRVLVFAPFFYCGYYCSREKAAKIGGLNKWVKIASAALLLVIFALIYKFSYIIKPTVGMMSGRNSYSVCNLGAEGAVYRLIYIAAAVLMSVLLMAAVPGKQRWYTALGGRTLQVYLIHALIFSVLFAFPWLLYEFVGDSLAKQLMLIPIAFVLTTALANETVKVGFDKVSSGFTGFLNKLFSLKSKEK